MRPAPTHQLPKLTWIVYFAKPVNKVSYYHHPTRHLSSLRSQEGAVGHEEEERRLEQRELVDVGVLGELTEVKVTAPSNQREITGFCRHHFANANVCSNMFLAVNRVLIVAFYSLNSM